MGPISGKYLEAKIGGMSPVFIPGNDSWKVEEAADELDGTTGEDEGCESPQAGVVATTITLHCWMDTVAGDYASIRTSTIITDLKLYRDKDDVDPAFHIATAVVLRSSQGGTIRGRMEIDATIKSVGNVVTYADPS